MCVFSAAAYEQTRRCKNLPFFHTTAAASDRAQLCTR
eukprot:IDg1575t1